MRLADLLGVPIDITELAEAEEAYATQVSEAVASDADTQAYVEELERRADSIELFAEGGELPTGETLAAELTRFLRERERDEGEPGGGLTTRLRPVLGRSAEAAGEARPRLRLGASRVASPMGCRRSRRRRRRRRAPRRAPGRPCPAAGARPAASCAAPTP